MQNHAAECTGCLTMRGDIQDHKKRNSIRWYECCFTCTVQARSMIAQKSDSEELVAPQDMSVWAMPSPVHTMPILPALGSSKTPATSAATEASDSWVKLPAIDLFDHATIAHHVVVNMPAQAFTLCVGRIMYHSRQSKEQSEDMLQLLAALVPAMVMPTSRGAFFKRLHERIHIPEVETVSFCPKCEALRETNEEKDATRKKCKACESPLKVFHAMDPTCLIEAFLVVYSKFYVTEADKAKYRVEEVYKGKKRTIVFDWIGGNRARSINFDRIVPYLLNADGAALVDTAAGESHYTTPGSGSSTALGTHFG